MRRRGNTAITVSLALTVLVAFGALAIDLGYARVVDLQVQTAADAASHAAAAQLDGTDAGLQAARAMAVDIAGRNEAGGVPVTLSGGDVTLGIWDDEAGTFAASEDAPRVNAVVVDARRPGLGLFLAPVMGRATVDVGARSMMVVGVGGGASEVDCFIPLAIAECMIDGYGLDGIQYVEFTLSPAPTDNVGWARPNGSPNASWTRSQIDDCQAGGTASIGDPVGLQNGVVASALSDLSAALLGSPTRWNTAAWGAQPARMAGSDLSAATYGRTYEGVVMVFDGGPGYCPSGGFNQSLPISGFMWGAVYDIKSGGASSSRNIRMRLDTTLPHEVATAAGGNDWGVTAAASPPHMRAPP